MSDSPEKDVVQRIHAHIASFQRSKVRLGASQPVVAAAARVGDPIKHKSFWAAVAGAVVGATISAAPYILCGFLGPFGAAARMAMMISDSLEALDNDTPKEPSWANKAREATENFINECFDDPDGFIIKGSSNVFVNGKPLAFAALENQDFTVQCNDHDKQRIAMGSETVFVNGNPVARKGNKTTCDAAISDGSPNVFFGSGQGLYAEIEPEFSTAQQVFITAVEMAFPPSKGAIKNGLGKIRLGIGEAKSLNKNIIKRNIKEQKRKQLMINRENGKLREMEVKKDFEDKGYKVYSQVSVKTSKSRRVIDNLIEKENKGNNEIKAIEVKSGNAKRNKLQIEKDIALEMEGGKIIGKNAPDHLRGKVIKIKTEVVK